MSREAYIIGAIEALCELVRLQKQRQVVKQEFDHANALFHEAVKTSDDMIDFLHELKSLREADKLSKDAERRILVQVANLLRNQVHLSEACMSILDRSNT